MAHLRSQTALGTRAAVRALLATSLEALGESVDLGLEGRLEVFLKELQQWNRVTSLTSYRDPLLQVHRLIIDSLLFLKVLPSNAGPLLDIGSGAGIPGVILKLARPGWDVVVVEAKRRRANFVRHVLRVLGVSDVVVHQRRVEALAGCWELRGRFRTVTMRAVMGPERAMAVARPFLGVDGALVLSLGLQAWTGAGQIREVCHAGPGIPLPFRRRFLIMAATEYEGNVPRGTRGARGAHPSRRQPEGRSREDHDGR